MEGIMKENEQAVHVIYASNDGYAGHLAASLCSLLDNNRHINDLDIYVLSAQMCEAFKERLKIWQLVWTQALCSRTGET